MKNLTTKTPSKLKKLEIFQAHFIGHDRGVIVFEHLMIRNKDLFLSLSRGAQVRDNYEDEWSELAPAICVGPPHRFMTKPWQLKLLFNLITFFEFPFAIRSEGFLNKCKDVLDLLGIEDKNKSRELEIFITDSHKTLIEI